MGVGAQNAGGEGVGARRSCGLEDLCVGGGCLVDTWAKSANWAAQSPVGVIIDMVLLYAC